MTDCITEIAEPKYAHFPYYDSFHKKCFNLEDEISNARGYGIKGDIIYEARDVAETINNNDGKPIFCFVCEDEITEIS